MNEAERRSLILRYWENGGSDPGVARETYHDDAVLEFPQSGERFEGLDNFREWRTSTRPQSSSCWADQRLRRRVGPRAVGQV